MATLFKAGTLCLAGLMLAGCNSLSRDAYRTMALAVTGLPPVATVDYVRALDRPALSARLNQSEALFVYGGQSEGFVEWLGTSQVLVIRNGRLVQSAGLPDQADLIAPFAEADPFLSDLRHIADGAEVTRLVDLPGRYLTGIPQHARYSLGPLQNREVMGQTRRLQRIDESIRMPALGFRTTNRYWIDPADGQVVISTQQLAPDMPELTLTVLVPPPGEGSQP